MITTPVFFDGGLALWALLGVGRYPIRSLRIIVTFFDPSLDKHTTNGVVPIFGAGKTEQMTTPTFHGSGLDKLDFHSVGTIRSRAPTHESIAVNKAVGDEVLIFELDF